VRIVAFTLDLRDELVDLFPKFLILVSCQVHNELLYSLTRSARLDLNYKWKREREREGGGERERKQKRWE
jgi:hypothetical protein